MNRQERIAFLKTIPWVKRLKTSVACDDFRWSHMPLKALYNMHGKPATGTDPYKCKSPAYWHFRALKRSHSRTGNYCYNHLFNHLHGDMDEQLRFKKWHERIRSNG